MVDPINGCTEINLNDPCLLPTLHCTLQCMGHAQKSITGIQTFPIRNLVVGSTPLHSINRPRRTDTRLSNTLDNTDVKEIGRKLATEEEGGSPQCWGDIGLSPAPQCHHNVGMTLARLQQAGKLPRRTNLRNTTLRRGTITSAVLLIKRET